MLRSLLVALLAVLVAAPLVAQTPLDAAQQVGETTLTGGANARWFGFNVSASGSRVLIGAPVEQEGTNNAGAAYVFAYNGTAWVQEARIPRPGSANPSGRFGTAVALLGDRAVITTVGSAYVFAYDGTTWTQEALLLPADGNVEFGVSVSLSGDRALIGAESGTGTVGGRSVGSAYVFAYDGSVWQQEAKLDNPEGGLYDYFGHDVSISGDRALVGANGVSSNRGAAYMFEYNGTSWVNQARLTGSQAFSAGDQFGISVSLTGNQALIGADEDPGGNRGGGAYIFEYDGASWVERQLLRPSDRAPNYLDRADDAFGISVALSGNEALIGAHQSNDRSVGDRYRPLGAAYRFALVDGVWTEQEKLTAPVPTPNERYGFAVSLSEGVGVVGAMFTAGGGAAYVYGVPDVRPDPLALSLRADPNPIQPGDPFTVNLEVTNQSDAPITALTPELTLTLTGDADAQFTGGPTPAAVASLAPGASATFTYTLDASGGAGSARFSANVEGRNNLGETVRAEIRRTIPFEDVALAASLVAVPSSPRAGNAFEVAVTVENVSDVPLRNVRPLAPPTITTTGAIASTLDAGPTPAGPVTLAVGARQTFRYTVTAADATFLRFSVRFGGDTEAGLAVSPVQAVDVIEVRPAQTILAELVAFREPTAPDPPSAGPDPTFTSGERFLVRLVVTNDLEVAVSGITAPAPLTVSGEGTATLVSGPTPAGPVTLQPGDNEFFDYVFEAASQGPLQFSASVLGKDPSDQNVPSNTAVLDGRVRVLIAGLTSASGPRVMSGLQPGVLNEDVRFVRFEDTADGRLPVCESGCADIIVQVQDQEGEPVEDEEIWVRAYATGTPLAGVDGGYFCERVVIGESGRCTPAVETSLLKLTTDADGRARIWVALQAVSASGDGDTGRELIVRAAFDFHDIEDPDAELTLPVLETMILDKDFVNLSGNSSGFATLVHQISAGIGAVSLGEICESYVAEFRDRALTPAQLTRSQRNRLLFWGANQIVPHTCSFGIAAFGSQLPVIELWASLDRVADPAKKIVDLLQMTWFAQAFDVDNASDLLQINAGLPAPLVVWVTGDVVKFADDVAGFIAASDRDREDRHQLVIQEASGIPQPFGATRDNDFEPSQFNGVLRMRWERGQDSAESLLSEGYKPVLRTFIGTEGYLVDNDNVAAGTARLAMVEAEETARRVSGEKQVPTVAAASAGATTVSVEAWDGEIGEYVEVGHRSETPEIVQVLAIDRAPAAGPTLTVTTPLRYAHPAGSVIDRIIEGTLAAPEPPVLRPHLNTAPPAVLAWVSAPTALAASYGLQVATDTTASALVLVIDEADITADSLIVDPARFADGTTYSWRIRATSGVGQGPWSRWQTFRPGTNVATEPEAPPTAVALSAPFPNPARSAGVTVSVDLPEAGPVRLAVYDALGREVAVALDGTLAAGRYPVALDTSGLPSGVYVVRLQAGGAVAVQRLTVVR